jgi:two-component system, LytTR family, response regulator
MRIKTIIAEDQREAREGLERLISADQNFEVVGVAKNGIEALELTQSMRPDLLLLDIQMPGANGFEVIYSLNTEVIPHVIFITAYDEFALKAFEVNAVDYILKPYTDQRLNEALQKARKAIASKSLPDSIHEIQRLIKFYDDHQKLEKKHGDIIEHGTDRFVIRETGKIRLVYFHDLIWVEAFDYYSKLHTVKGTYLIRKPIKEIEAELSSDFVRIHRSFIIKIDQIKQILKEPYGGTALLKNGHSISISSRYWKSVKLSLNQ